MHGTYYEASCLDRHAVGRDVKHFTEYVLQQTPIDLAGYVQTGNAADVLFDNLVRDPVETVRRVYQQLHWDFSVEYENILRAHVAADKLKREADKSGRGRGGGKHGMYQHSPDRFGLEQFDFTEEEGVYGEYIKKYGLQECTM